MRRPLLIVLAALGACTAPALLVRDVLPPPAVGDTLSAPDPGRAGTFTVRSLYYGSGTDRRRAEYRDSVTLKTRAVNGTPFVRGGDPKRLKAR